MTDITRTFRSGGTVRVSLPRRIRKHLGLLPGDYVVWTCESMDRVTLRRAEGTTAKRLRGTK